MEIRNIMFDLDGTLLPMDQDKFVEAYFGRLAGRVAAYEYDPKEFIKMVWKGTGAMVMNDGSCTNEEVFWKCMVAKYGEKVRELEPVFIDFYKNDFDHARSSCGFDCDAAKVVKELKNRGYRLFLATNPIFPGIATEKRIGWAGLDINDFEHVTVYENSCFSKPNPKYYGMIMEKFNLDPKETLMVGNDVDEDMVASVLGINVFLVTRDLINKNSKDISDIRKGELKDLLCVL